MELADIRKDGCFFRPNISEGRNTYGQKSNETIDYGGTFQKIRGWIPCLLPTGSKDQPEAGRPGHPAEWQQYFAYGLPELLLCGSGKRRIT